MPLLNHIAVELAVSRKSSVPASWISNVTVLRHLIPDDDGRTPPNPATAYPALRRSCVFRCRKSVHKKCRQPTMVCVCVCNFSESNFLGGVKGIMHPSVCECVCALCKNIQYTITIV